MATTDEAARIAALEAQVAALERELADQAAAAGGAVAAAQDRALELAAENAQNLSRADAKIAKLDERLYWLDRWQLDLNEIMRRRDVTRLRAVVRVVRRVVRLLGQIRRRLPL